MKMSYYNGYINYTYEFKEGINPSIINVKDKYADKLIEYGDDVDQIFLLVDNVDTMKHLFEKGISVCKSVIDYWFTHGCMCGDIGIVKFLVKDIDNKSPGFIYACRHDYFEIV